MPCVQSAARFDEQSLDFFGIGLMQRTFTHNELSRTDMNRTVEKIDPQIALDYKEGLIYLRAR